ncbi:hypothetical protein EVAR_64155_1 [Eumeta japonica]|uniref:Uncharacterized protein n=1 Tax=Eumeta variegata TaxID=151549 RepID=A0A4C1ZMG3_EUMVA|nr:hypothetical protein EVAR_64155_1 [Eumeta japonica]
MLLAPQRAAASTYLAKSPIDRTRKFSFCREAQKVHFELLGYTYLGARCIDSSGSTARGRVGECYNCALKSVSAYAHDGSAPAAVRNHMGLRMSNTEDEKKTGLLLLIPFYLAVMGLSTYIDAGGVVGGGASSVFSMSDSVSSELLLAAWMKDGFRFEDTLYDSTLQHLQATGIRSNSRGVEVNVVTFTRVSGVQKLPTDAPPAASPIAQAPQSTLYVRTGTVILCVIENDMENYTKYMLVGGRIKLKQGMVPHKFKCQREKEDKPQRSAVQKRNRIEYFEKLLNKDETSTLEKPEEIFVVSCEDEIVIEDPLSFGNNDQCLEISKKMDETVVVRRRFRVFSCSSELVPAMAAPGGGVRECSVRLWRCDRAPPAAAGAVHRALVSAPSVAVFMCS